ERMTGGADKPSILSDSLEALLGAVFLDGGFEAAQGIVARLWEPLLAEAEGSLTVKDHKTRLQEFVQKRAKATPSYRILDCAGPDHERVYRVEVSLKGEILGRGEGRSKKEAEQAAAQAALAFLSSRETEP
ncbi:MAG: putative dsRNA-binding protein, partial [Thermodesulfobacteriota bacterium]